MYLTRYPFRSFNFPDPKARNLYLDVNFSPPSFVPRVSNGLLLSFPVFQRLISYQREREEELSFCYLFSSQWFSRQKIIRDLILNFFLPPSSFDRICIGGDNCEQQESREYSKTWHTRERGFKKDGGSFLRFKFIYICIPCARDRLPRAMNNPRRRYWFRPRSRTCTAHPFRSDSAPRVTSPRARPPPTPAEIRCYEIHRFETLSAPLYRGLMADVWDDSCRKKSAKEFFFLLLFIIFVSLKFNLNEGGERWIGRGIKR